MSERGHNQETTARLGLTLVLGALVLLFSMTVFADFDFWWHTRLGEDILNTGQIVLPDTFSYTFEGEEQFNAEWLGDVLIHLAHRAGGFVGANLLKALLVALMLFFLHRSFCESEPCDRRRFLASLLTLGLVLLAIRFRLFVRPFLISYLFVAVFLFLLERYDSKRDVRMLFALPVFQLVWANSSKGAFIGVVIVGVYCASAILSGKWNRQLLWSFPAVFAASLVNPDGWTVYSSLVNLLIGGESLTLMEVGEHQPLSPALLWGHGIRYTFGAQILAVGGFLYLLFSRGTNRAYYALLYFTFLIPAIFAVRFLAFFAIVVSVMFFGTLARTFQLLPERRDSSGLIEYVGAIGLLALIGVSAVSSETFSFGARPKEDTFPDGAVDHLDRNQVDGRMFNSYSFGGYLIWRAPDRPVFIDGRGGHLYPMGFVERYQNSIADPEVWRAEEERWGFSYAVVDYDLQSGNKHFPLHLNDNPDWALVYWDRQSAVYLKRVPENMGTISRQEYVVTRPSANDFSYLMHYGGDPETLGRVFEQIEKEIAFNPDNQEPRLAKVFLLHNFGSPQGRQLAFDELEVCLKMPPDLAMEHSAAAFFHRQRGSIEDARRELQTALQINPADPLAKDLAAKLELPKPE